MSGKKPTKIADCFILLPGLLDCNSTVCPPHNGPNLRRYPLIWFLPFLLRPTLFVSIFDYSESFWNLGIENRNIQLFLKHHNNRKFAYKYSTLKQQLHSFTTWITLVHAYTLPSSDILKHLADKVEDWTYAQKSGGKAAAARWRHGVARRRVPRPSTDCAAWCRNHCADSVYCAAMTGRADGGS